MNKPEARMLLNQHMEHFRRLSYAELVAFLGEPQVDELIGPSGTHYIVEVEVFWDSQVDGEIRVLGAIDDGGWRAFMPLSTDFVVAPDGRFVGE
jgi:hypothetical protein